MNRDPGANPNVIWPRRVAAGLFIALGAAGCTATGPQEIAEGKTSLDPVECNADYRHTFEVEPTVEAIKQNIDDLLCATANEAAASALARYRENGILITSRDEGPEDDGELYSFSYSVVGGDYVAVEFGTTPDNKPDLADLRRVYISQDEYVDGEVVGAISTAISRKDDGSWGISGLEYDTDNNPVHSSDSYYGGYSDARAQQDLATMQAAQDKAFELSLNFIGIV